MKCRQCGAKKFGDSNLGENQKFCLTCGATMSLKSAADDDDNENLQPSQPSAFSSGGYYSNHYSQQSKPAKAPSDTNITNILLCIVGIVLGLVGVGLTLLNIIIPFIHWAGFVLGGAAIGIGSSQWQKNKGALPILCIVAGALSFLAFVVMLGVGCALGCAAVIDAL